MGLGLSRSLLGPLQVQRNVGVSEGGGSSLKDSAEGSPVLHGWTADPPVVRNVSRRPTGTCCCLCSFLPLPSAQPKRCAPELRQNYLYMTYLSAPLNMVSLHYSLFLTNQFCLKELKVVCFCVLVFKA